MKADKKKIITLVGVLLFVGAIVALCVVFGGRMMEFLAEPGAVREWAGAQGLLAPICFAGLMAMQIILAFIPGEPLEIAAGYAFGAVQGTILCMVGALVGSLLVYLFVKKFGMRVVEVFFPREKIRSIKWLNDERKLSATLLMLFLIPGTPKDIMTYAVGLTAIKLPKWLAISTFARIPSIVTSTISGDALGLGDYTFAIIVFGATLIVSVIGLIVYNKVSARKGQAIS